MDGDAVTRGPAALHRVVSRLGGDERGEVISRYLAGQALPVVAADLVGGLCAEVGPELWHPEKGDNSREAFGMCDACDIRSACLEYALAGVESGIWGGSSDSERRALRAELARRQESGQAA